MLQLLLLFSCKHELLRLQFLNTILISAFILRGLNNRSGLQQFLFQMFQLLPILRIPLSGLLLKVEEGDQLLRCHVYIISWDLVMSYLLTAVVVVVVQPQRRNLCFRVVPRAKIVDTLLRYDHSLHLLHPSTFVVCAYLSLLNCHLVEVVLA